MDTEYQLTLRDIIDIARRRLILISSIFFTLISVTIAISIITPPVYQSSGTILIESQKISSDIISSTVTGFAAERIELIKQRVMTRENLTRIIKKYKLFGVSENDQVTSGLIDNIRAMVNIEILSTDIAMPRRGNKTNIAFSIAFENRHPELAYAVTNELVTLFLDENIKSRIERANETTEFLTQEAKRLKIELEKMESKVAQYKQEHSSALPEHLELKMGILERTQKTLTDLDKDYKEEEVELNRLELELASERSGAGENSPISELENLKAEYNKAKLIYKENHPTIRMLKHKIDTLNKSMTDGSGMSTTGSNIVNTALVSKLKSMISTTKRKLSLIEQQRKPLREKINELEEQIAKTPQVELGLNSLLRDHGNAKKKYEEIQAKMLNAQIAQNLEGENKSERFTLIDPPLFPDKPIKPNRVKIIFIGLLLAIAASAGGAFTIEMLNEKIRGHQALTSTLGYSPLVEIPYITTEAEKQYRRTLLIRFSVAIAIAIVVSLMVLHFAYMNIDLLLIKIISRFG